jgi:hypothetical protein
LNCALKIRLYITFCRSFAATSIIVTALCLFWLILWGMDALPPIIFFKIALIALTVYFIDIAKSKEYYYYSNLGISKKRLWRTAIIADMLLFIALTVILALFRHAALH